MKIALVGERLSGGGAERVQARLSHHFEKLGIQVHHIIFIDEVSYSYAGNLFNLGALKKPNEGLWGKWKRFQRLRKYVLNQGFDYIIDFRVKHNYAQEWFLNKFVFKAPYIMSVRSNHLDFHFPAQKWLAKILYRNSIGIVAVSKAISKSIQVNYPYLRVTTIYNPIDIDEIEKKAEDAVNTPAKYLLAVGRLHKVKQFDQLIQAYHRSGIANKGIHLLILGEGEELSALQTLVEKLNLRDFVAFKAFVNNPFPYYKNAQATVLCSKYEGFPNVLIESLACGTPVISYDCATGPNEIITHEANGLLVPDQNPEALSEAMASFIEDKTLYETCKQNAKSSVARFAGEVIAKQWIDFLTM